MLASLLPPIICSWRSPGVLMGRSASVVMHTSRGVAVGSAPSIESLRSSLLSTSVGSTLAEEAALRAEGNGPPHTDALLRLFGKSESDVRVTLYRDTAAWCPYCQKVWLLLEEKQIPFRVKKINMRSYGDKPPSFLQRVPGGLLPALELDDQFYTDSLPIMALLDGTFDQGPKMIPARGTADRKRAEKLLQLERELFGAWCRLTFQPGLGIFDGHKRYFLEVMSRVDTALGETEGPWFLGGDAPSLVDLQYVSHVERMVASVAFWKGMKIRGDGAGFSNLDRWLQAFEERPAYMATKSDPYTHVMDIPPQYGPGFSIDEAKPFADRIMGRDGSWSLPLRLDRASDHLAIEPLPPLINHGEEAARHEAASKLIGNFDNVVRFAARGTGKPGRPQFQVLSHPCNTPRKVAACHRLLPSALPCSLCAWRARRARQDCVGVHGSVCVCR